LAFVALASAALFIGAGDSVKGVPLAVICKRKKKATEVTIVFRVAGLIADRKSLFFRWQALFVFDRQALTRANCGFEFFRPRAHLFVRMARLDLQKEKDCFLDWVPHRLLSSCASGRTLENVSEGFQLNHFFRFFRLDLYFGLNQC
jgi:hypothetical protein